MKKSIVFIIFMSLILTFCKTGSKTTGSSVNPLEPGEAQLKAMQGKYADITMQTLKDGYAVYTGPCVKCHGKKKIFSRSEEEWIRIISKMAPKSKLNEIQKDALTKYIFSMKATQPSGK